MGKRKEHRRHEVARAVEVRFLTQSIMVLRQQRPPGAEGAHMGIMKPNEF
jgi:hypothetical protein